ncbi:sulfur carrier protein ThiS [Martelella alba]|uniref:Sulfur carrier protein ThiS n=1 Tax=Martelella alba TaxID=2590451 RepID=A0ABY2SEE2_9HYPH|nr:sulfur carrier protein ThiS [Martelella alba]TKI03132.1 sulfur carrier protein ThiS [Martelella alba]
MKIHINERPVELDAPLSLDALLKQLRYPPEGAALAINHTVIPRGQWPHRLVQDGDDILLFQAIAGG